MSYRYVYDPAGWEEYKEAIKWYQERSEQAAVNFVRAVSEKVALICSAPTSYRNLYKQYRETSLKRYHYSIVYLVDEKKKMVIITSVYHHRRNPNRKYRKR